MSHAQNKLTNRQNNARKWAVGYRVESNSTSVVAVRYLLDNGGRLLQPPLRGVSMSDDFTCDRCDHDLAEYVAGCYEDGGRLDCPRCGLKIPTPSAEWHIANGYEVEA